MSTRRVFAGLVVLGFAAGLAVAAVAASVVERTNTDEFCVSCHEMEIALEELRQTAHYSNASGVRASCADCHIPHDSWWSMVAYKSRAGARDVFAHLRGKLETRDDYERHREAMAERVWERMRANDSRNCRGCHRREAMDLDAQPQAARVEHREAKPEETCIDCHQGVAHELPESAKEQPEAEGDFTL